MGMIDGQRVDVVTQGELIEKDTPIKVIQVEGRRVVVAVDG
jgi:membrane-bound ClpP family serine protease